MGRIGIDRLWTPQQTVDLVYYNMSRRVKCSVIILMTSSMFVYLDQLHDVRDRVRVDPGDPEATFHAVIV
jgi:hypothetical protein